jgi:hypothetical protein
VHHRFELHAVLDEFNALCCALLYSRASVLCCVCNALLCVQCAVLCFAVLQSSSAVPW